MPTSDVSGGEDLDLESLTEDLSRHSRSASVQSIREARCCCGRENCVFLQRSQELISALEKDVQTAARLGQALLRRHERSMAESQQERMTMTNAISALESKTAALELENSKTIEENKNLLASLEDANTEMTMCEGKMKGLQEELDSTHAEFSSISAAAARAEVLEAQLAVLESEQAELRNMIAASKEEEKIAKLRSQKAERSVRELEQQLDRIEREHALEKARAANMLERLEPRKFGGQQTGTYPTALVERTALSRFMKEIMAENSHLQYGVAELKDMLQASQEEANLLREKLHMLDQENYQAKLPLSTELSRDTAQSFQTIIHHHHYHPTAGKGKSRPQARKPKKRRSPAMEHFATLGGLASSRRNTSPTTSSQVWSPISHTTTTSPASPVSTFHESSIFDLRHGQESSRPTSADSNTRSMFSFSKKPLAGHTHIFSNTSGPPFSILHTNEEEAEPSSPRLPHRPQGLHRSISHESLLSVVDSSFVHSPDVTSSSFSSSPNRSPAFTGTAMANGPQAQARITPGIVIRSPGGAHGSSAYSRLLGLQQESRPSLAKSPSDRYTGSSNTGSSWLWRWGNNLTGSSPNERQKKSIVRGKRVPSTPAVLSGYVDEDLLKESLNEEPALP